MRRPNNYDEAKVQGEYIPVELGGHKMVIKGVEEKVSKTNKPMLKVEFDFAPGDKQAGYFTEAFRDDIRPDKKWPNQGTAYVIAIDAEGNCTSQLKTLCTCLEHSNAGFECWKPDETLDIAGMQNKQIGGVFGPQKDYYNGRVSDKRVLRRFVSVDKVAEAQIPRESETKAYRDYQEGHAQMPSPDADGFMNIPDGIDEELPFN